ncbi:MAG: hypothetical protein GF311_23380 [Candidatus Lokiarchaeota archaeon]|nr:hypothetical protein [Candidatus Lokiarchaeota archaeon]
MGDIKSLEDFLNLRQGRYWPSMSTVAKPVSRFYLILISSIGGMVVSIFLMVKATKVPERIETIGM